MEKLSNLLTIRKIWFLIFHWKLDGTCFDLRLARSVLGGSNIFPALTLKTNTGLKPQGGLEFRWIPCFFFNVIFISKPIAIPSRAITNGVFYLCLSTRPRCGVFAGLELFYWRDALDSQIRSHQTHYGQRGRVSLGMSCFFVDWTTSGASNAAIAKSRNVLRSWWSFF